MAEDRLKASIINSNSTRLSFTGAPRSLYDQIEKLDFQNVREAVEEYLNDKEINAVLIRRDLILQEINSRIQMLGEDAVLY